MGYSTLKAISEKLRLTKRHTLHHSRDKCINKVWTESIKDHILSEETLNNSNSLTAAQKKLKLTQLEEAWSHMSSLSSQGASVKVVVSVIEKSNIITWSNKIANSAEIIYNFAHKALLQTLPTAANLTRWKKSLDPNCQLCKQNLPQTNKHVLSNCPSPFALQRYTSRHNEILQILCMWLKSVLTTNQQLFADISVENTTSTSKLFRSLRPDMAICEANTVTIYELTVCHETNLIKSKEYKLNKYRNLANDALPLIEKKTISCYSLEISVLGFISSELEFTRACRIPSFPDMLKLNIIQAVLNSSYIIYCNRNFS